MRLTINLDDDLYALARSHAIATQTSMSKAVGNLLRRKTAAGLQEAPTGAADFAIHPGTLLPVVRGAGTLITDADGQSALDDEDLRHLDMAGARANPSPRP
ncbi:MAG: hypothetical protein WCO57_00790 [Verrucomicrobiota bacterium]